MPANAMITSVLRPSWTTGGKTLYYMFSTQHCTQSGKRRSYFKPEKYFVQIYLWWFKNLFGIPNQTLSNNTVSWAQCFLVICTILDKCFVIIPLLGHPEGRPLHESWPKKLCTSSSSTSTSSRHQSLRSGMSGPPSMLYGWKINQMTDDGWLMSLDFIWYLVSIIRGGP